MLPKCAAPQECCCHLKRNKKQRKRWRDSEAANGARKNFFSKLGCSILITMLCIQISNSQQSSNFNHGGFSSGDPAPGRSPGPPVLERSNYDGAPDYEEETDRPTVDARQEPAIGRGPKEIQEAESVKAGNISVVNNFTAKIIVQNSDDVVQDSDSKTTTCDLKRDDFESDVRVVEAAASGLNLTFEHSVFKSDDELVRGVTYDVILTSFEGDERVDTFVLESLVDDEERGEFSMKHKDDQICIISARNKPTAQPSHFQHPSIPENVKRKQIVSTEKRNRTFSSNQVPVDDYDINTEKNDVPVWENLSIDTKNDILDEYKLENSSHNMKMVNKNEEIDVNFVNNTNSQRKMVANFVNNSKAESDDSESPPLVETVIVSESVKKRRQVFKRDATNFIYSNEDTARIPGLFVEENGGAKEEVVTGHQVYGKIPKTIRLNWKLSDARLAEEKTANVTFRLRYKTNGVGTVYQVVFRKKINLECQLSLYRPSGRLSWGDIPRSPTDCQVFFPSASAQKHGLLVTLQRLNVPCISGGFIRLNPGSPPSTRSRTDRHNHLCGKLEELPDSERNLYISATETRANPYLHVHGTPSFVISYRLVDYCYNVTLTARSGSFEIEPTNSLHCTFRIHLPYGNRVALRLQMGERALKAPRMPEITTLSASPTDNDNNNTPDIETEFSTLHDSREAKVPECSGLSIKLWDGTNSWVHCSKSGDPLRNVQIISKQNNVIMYVVIKRTLKNAEYNKIEDIKINKDELVKVEDSVKDVNENNVFSADDSVKSSNESDVTKRSVSDVSDTTDSMINDTLGLFLKLWYHAEPIEDVVGQCSYAWVSLRQFCVTVFDHARLPWAQAEAECVRQGGHLVSIRSELDQTVLDQLLIQSPGYREQNAYWVGASDRASEGDFRWSDGLPFSFTHWFPGWASHGGYNRQPNDDGLSAQDCVEVRRAYSPPAPARPALAPSHRWNDRDCGAPNYYVCERPLADEPVGGAEGAAGPSCEAALPLGRARPRAQLTSPGFPRAYPDGARCDTAVTAPKGYRVVLDFEELVLEQEPDCSYDYLEIWEPLASNHSSSSPSATADPSVPKRRLCGDWSSRLKLLRHVSKGPRLNLRFVSDYSHHYTGFKATLTMENVMECSDDRQKLFNDSCYLIVSYPEVTWSTAQQICRGARAELASIFSPEEEKFLTATIRNSAEYSNSAIYWLGAKMSGLGTYDWGDGTRVLFSGWLPGKRPEDMDILEIPDPENPTCLGIQWMTSPTPMLPSGLYWTSQKCSHVGGYVCKRKHQLNEPNLKLNKTINDTEGRLISPNYPGNYPNNLNYVLNLIGPENTRLVIQFAKIDMEFQKDCLYDYVEIKSLINGVPQTDPIRTCGSHDTDMRRFDFVSLGRSALVWVKSDYSITGGGFSMRWRAVDVSACPRQTLTARHGTVKSPNWPHFLLAKLDCTYTIIAPPGKRVWLEITEHSLGAGSALEVSIGEGGPLRPFLERDRLADGAFLSVGEALELRLRTGDHPTGMGFTADYKIVGFAEEERIIQLGNSSSGSVLHVNYPRAPPLSADLTLRVLAPQGYSVLLRLHSVKFSDGDCPEGKGKIEVFDRYADVNGTRWGLCEDDTSEASSPVSITSYFNSLRVRQRSTSTGVRLNATVTTQIDVTYRTKLMQVAQDAAVESCRPNPCLNGGRCLLANGRNSCQCFGHFTGIFCALTACELEPCVFGACTLTAGGHRCSCRAGYTGAACETRVRPCEARPCEGRGRCEERARGFHCNCYAWWEGTRCERRMMNIPYKPLSERMLQEPFWLGLITVFVVLAIIGLVWCAKRHFPEKIEKLLAEEADRNRPNHLSLRQSAREAAMCQGPGALAVSTPSTAGAGAAGPARGSLFNRLGIRKPSILSLSPGPVPAARTFSLDDLLRPPPRRTPSPRKKRNNSTPTKKNAAEKKQILQQLISPAASQNLARKVSMGELIQMSERRAKESEDGKLSANGVDSGETSFANGDRSVASTSVSISQLSDPKLEKKVTFARLLNKVSAEMSSGSEIEIGNLALHHKTKVKSSSTPPSPATDMRSPHSNSSNQGSDSMSSLEAALPGMGLRKFAGRANKISSADSILAMFRNFSSTTTGFSMPSSIVVSPSTTPSASSPQDDIAGDDDSTTSSLHTPVSISSGAPDSPVYYRQSNSQCNTIEVPVLDVLTAHKANISGCNLLHPPSILLEIPSSINKCLSPIRELPTPLPSPALTPIMHRSQPSSQADYDELDVSDDHISLEIPLSQTEDEDEEVHSQNISILAHDGARGGPAVSPRPNSNASSLKNKARPSPIGRDTSTPSTQMTDDTPSPLTHSHDSDRELSSSCGRATASPRDLSPSLPKLVIPLLTVEQPSPTRHYPTGLMFAGSPPPQRASIGETSFHFPSKQQQKRLLKEFEKPTSLDLASAPPLITITCNMSEAESDAEPVSPAARVPRQSLAPTGPSTMCYLSPFSICTRGDRTISDSNLSSSGYSSMASPGPSRCGSSNPLCPSEMEDPGSGPTSLHPALAHRRPSPLLRTISNPSGSGATNNNPTEQKRHCRGRSDSETLSDDPLLESNDEGISTDHLEERIEDVDLKSAKELEVFLKSEMTEAEKSTVVPVLHVSSLAPPKGSSMCGTSAEKVLDRLNISASVPKMSLQLPSIVIQGDSSSICEKLLSPVSSRSESPLSDRTIGVGRFSPHFYGRHKDQLPFTDSDGLYDFPSSDCVHQNSSGSGNKINMTLTSQPHRKSTGRRRERKNSRNNTGSKTPSPTKAQLPHSMQNLLDVPGKDVHFRTPTPRKLSPKRRSRSQQPVSSSSSSESINSAREVTVRLSPEPKSPQSVEGTAGSWPKQEWAAEASGEETGEDVSARMLPKSPVSEEIPKPIRKISRMRTIGHQIRFLRRLEQSLQQRERFTAAGNSDEEGDESSSVTSPLLQQSRAPRPQIRKSQSIGRMQAPAPAPGIQQIRPKVARQKKGITSTTELLQSQDSPWRGSLGMAGPNDISD